MAPHATIMALVRQVQATRRHDLRLRRRAGAGARRAGQRRLPCLPGAGAAAARAGGAASLLGGAPARPADLAPALDPLGGRARGDAGARGQEPALRHPRCRPAARAGGRRGGPAADPADLRRDRPDLRPGRADGGVRRHRPARARARSTSTRCSSMCAGSPQAGFARHHRIVELYDPSLPEVEGDRDRLIQVVLEPGQERRRGGARRGRPDHAGRPSTSTGCAWP